ncbi:hypothetical protein BH09BAC2_BH09BAC2_17100 [soil metagenome]
MRDAQKKILLVHLYSNGDCLYATTVAKQIKKDYPGCHLTWAVATFCKNIIANNPDVDALMEVDSVKKDDAAAFSKFRKEILDIKNKGAFDEVFITQIQGKNLAYYDGCIRSNILAAYPKPITVSKKPVLHLFAGEIANADSFAEQHQLKNYSHVILFEYAPLSGQLKITKEMALSIADNLTDDPDIAVILSSANKISHTKKNIIDGSVLSVRETAALTHYCTFLLGCSSGITWITTSEAAKLLPMVQILDADAVWINPVSRDFERNGFSTSGVIELIDFNKKSLMDCVKAALQNFTEAKRKYNQPIPLQFKTTRRIVYNLLVYLHFAAIVRHVKVNKKIYGNNPAIYKEVFIGVVTAPFKLCMNIFKKK